jgi:ACS family sodium-dependent inorganic phosphate cotransporter
MPHICTFLFLNIAGFSADHLIKNGMAVIKVRKLMMLIGFGGISISMLSVGFAPDAYVAIAIMSAGAALGAFVTGGFSVNHMDLAPRHAGSLLGITNTAGTFAGAISVYFAGWI